MVRFCLAQCAEDTAESAKRGKAQTGLAVGELEGLSSCRSSFFSSSHAGLQPPSELPFFASSGVAGGVSTPLGSGYYFRRTLGVKSCFGARNNKWAR